MDTLKWKKENGKKYNCMKENWSYGQGICHSAIAGKKIF